MRISSTFVSGFEYTTFHCAAQCKNIFTEIHSAGNFHAQRNDTRSSFPRFFKVTSLISIEINGTLIAH